MAVKLDYIIDASNFELVRDRIAIILKEELDNQANLRGSGSPVEPDSDYTADVYTERFVPIDKSEPNVIIVSLKNSNLNNRTPVSQSNECDYVIDVFTTAKQTANFGYYNSAIKLHRLIGLVRHILMSPYYDRLDFDNGIIESRAITQFQFAEVRDEQDALFSRMARATFNVRIIEKQNQITPAAAEGYDSRIKIENTEKGFLLTYNN